MFYSTPTRPLPHRYIYVGQPDNLKQRTDVSAEREYSSRVGFSGSGSVGVLSRRGEKKSEFTPNCQREFAPSYVEYKDTTPCGTDNVVRISLAELPDRSYLVKSFNPSQRAEYLSQLAERAKFARSLERMDRDDKPRRIAKGLTSRGRNCISNGSALLEYRYGVRKLGFYTLTCPFTDSAGIQLFNDSLPEIMRRYFQELKREYERRSLTFSYVGCYEVQPGRYRRTGDQCLHVHYIAPALDRNNGFILSHGELRDLYSRIVRKVCGEELPQAPRIDAQLIKSSAGGYLAKYFSKGKSLDDDGGRVGAVAELSTWYCISRNLLTAIRKSTLELPGHIADELFRSSASGTKLVYATYIRPVFIELDGKPFHVGCVFRLCGDFLSKLKELVFPQVEYLL